jgi:hypothetical protein
MKAISLPIFWLESYGRPESVEPNGRNFNDPQRYR